MADLDFESHLERLFAEAPAFPDADRFAARVEARLDRAWTVRRLMIGTFGLVGGVIAASEMLGGRVFDRLHMVSSQSLQNAYHSVDAFAPQWRALSHIPYSGEILWMAAGLAALGLAMLANRSMEEF